VPAGKGKGKGKVDAAELLANPLFRLFHGDMYKIVTKEKDASGRDVSKWSSFAPFEHQKVMYKKLYKDGCRRLLIPKARRMGFSTAINMSQFDYCLWNKDFHSKIVDQNQSDATDKLVNRIQRAWRHIDENFDLGIKHVNKNQSSIDWTNGSMFTADTSGRGGSAVHFLHVSELGPIDFEDPKRADEIIDGAFPAADGGIIVVESTAKGPIGHFKRLCDNAMEIPDGERTAEDFEVMFFAWHDDPRHTMEGKFSRVSKANNAYLDEVEHKTGKKFSEAQRLWYHVTSERVGKIRYEYPSLLEECWEQPVDGAIYADLINEARGDGRVGKFPYHNELPVYTIWDIGNAENTRCVFFQKQMDEYRVIDACMGGYDAESKIDGPREPHHWAKVLGNKGYNYAAHILPHDGAYIKDAGVSFKSHLQRAGLNNVVTLQRRNNAPNERIRETCPAFNRFYFNAENPNVKILLSHLERYHYRKEHDGITVKDKPHGDFASHYADAFGSIIEADRRGKVDGGVSGIRKKRRKTRREYEYSAFK
tara:strand:- start:9662 stop:11266 length:1605 start_codon:yes stop_codon:yes gene_type:complete